MKSFSKNIWFWAAVFLFIINLGTLTCLFSRIEKHPEKLDIRYFYPGQPGDARCSPEIIFNMPVVPKAEVGSGVDRKLIKIEPSIPGGFTWSDRCSIKFTPFTAIDAATEYNIVEGSIMTNSERDELLIEISKNVAVINTKLDTDYRAIYGNGKPGLIHNVDLLKERVQAIEDAHKAESKHGGMFAAVIAFTINAGIALYALFRQH